MEFLLRTFPLSYSRDLEKHLCLYSLNPALYECKPPACIYKYPFADIFVSAFSPSLFWEFTKRSGKPVAKAAGKSSFLPVAECSQPLQTAESFPQG